jgi:uncharacterized protein (TIGR02285 family)
MRAGIRAGLPILALLAGSQLLAAQPDQITLYYPDRPPFISTDADGKVTGLIAEPTERIFRRAQLNVHWVRVPQQRVLPALKANQALDCSPGWYRTPEREAMFRYSLPIYLDRPFAALVRADLSGPDEISAVELLARPGLRVVLRQNMAHGDYVDGLIGKMPPSQVQSLSVDSVPLVKMIYAGHVDLTVVTDEEAERIIADAGLKPADFRLLRFTDVAKAEARHIICNQQVPEAMMARLNKAIKALGLP